MSTEAFLLTFAVVLAVGRIGSEVAERLGQPAVLGELLGGVIIGVGALRWLNPSDPIFHTLAEVGVLLLLFEVGLECDSEALLRSGGPALWVACAGVVLPMALGYGVSVALGLAPLTALFVGAALTATSVGLTARVFSDLGRLRSREATIVLGAAVADDVIGLILLAVVGGLASAAGATMGSVGKLLAIALLFLVGGLLIGAKAAPIVMSLAARMRSRGAIGTAAVVFCLLMATAAGKAELAPIVGAFAAGLVLARTEHSLHIERAIKPVADLFIPVFFVCMGAATDLSRVSPFTSVGRSTLLLASLLLIVAVVGKVLGGLTVPCRGLNRWVVGVGMIPRGEVGLIFANLGLAHKILNPAEYAAVVAVVLGTTLLTPPFLRRLLSSQPSADPEADAEEDLAPFSEALSGAVEARPVGAEA